MSSGQTEPLILIVDDDPGLSFLIEQALRREKWQTFTANSGTAALEWLGTNTAELILLDLKLQDIDAVDLITRLEEIGPLAPFMIITGRGDEKVAVEMMKRGAMDYLTKDVQFLDLLPGVIRTAFKQIQQQRRLIAAEDSLQQSEARFRLMADHAPVLVWMSSPDKLCTWFNRPWLDFTGRRLEQELGAGWCEGVHPDDLAGCLETYGKAFDARKPFTMEYRLRRHDGQWRWIYDQGVPLAPSGKFSGYLGSCIDITDRKRAEEALKKSEENERARAEELAALLDAVPMPVFIAHDSDGRHITGNRAADALLQNPRGSEASLSDSEAVKPHFKAMRKGKVLSNDELPAQKAARGFPVDNFEFTLLFEDGTERDVLGYGAPLRDESGRPRGAINVLVDITERKRMEKQILEIAEREQIRIGQDLHDGLGQELTAIEFLCESIKHDLRRKNPEIVPRLDQISYFLQESISHTRLISHGLAPVKMTSAGLMDSLRELADLVSKTGRATCTLECPVPVLINDCTTACQLFRIAQEAANNALKHAHARNIAIRLYETPEFVRLTISDDGTGFAAGKNVQKGIGLEVMHHRASVIGAKLEVNSTSSGVTISCGLFKEYDKKPKDEDVIRK